MFLLIVLSLIAIGAAQQQRPCTSPSQWEARVHSSNWKLSGDLQGQLSYDSVSQRTRILQKTKVGQIETYYDIISLYQAKLVFYIDKKSGNCSYYLFDQPWHDFGVQSDAVSRGTAYIGSSMLSAANLLVTIWFVYTFHHLYFFSGLIFVRAGNQTIPFNKTARYLGVWTYEECIPVSNISFEPNGSINYIRYYDLTLGINEPNVFVPPEQCFHAKKRPISHTIFDQYISMKV